MSGNQKVWGEMINYEILKQEMQQALCRLFETRNGASVVWRTFWSNCEQRGQLNEPPIVDVHTWVAWNIYYAISNTFFK